VMELGSASGGTQKKRSRYDNKGEEEEEEEDEVITLRFVDRKYHVPASALAKISFFNGILGKTPLAGTARQEDGSYFVPELAGDRFESLLVRVAGLLRVDPLMYHPALADDNTHVPAFDAVCQEVCTSMFNQWKQSDGDKPFWRESGSARDCTRTYFGLIPRVIFADPQQQLDGITALRSGNTPVVLLRNDVSNVNGTQMKLSERVTNEYPLVATAVHTHLPKKKYNAVSLPACVSVCVTLRPRNTTVVISEVPDEDDGNAADANEKAGDPKEVGPQFGVPYPPLPRPYGGAPHITYRKANE